MRTHGGQLLAPGAPRRGQPVCARLLAPRLLEAPRPSPRSSRAHDGCDGAGRSVEDNRAYSPVPAPCGPQAHGESSSATVRNENHATSMVNCRVVCATPPARPVRAMGEQGKNGANVTGEVHLAAAALMGSKAAYTTTSSALSPRQR